MRQKIEMLLKDGLVSRMVKIFTTIIILYFIVGIWKWRELPPQLPLFYSLPRSPEQLGTPILLFILPFFSLLFFVINFLIASYIFFEEKLAAYFLVIIGVIASILLFISFIKIVLLIT